MKHKLCHSVLILLTVGWMALIFGFSAQSGEQSGGLSALISGPVTKLLADMQDLPEDAADALYWQVDGGVRTAAHFGEYAVLGGLLLLVCRRIRWAKRWLPWLLGTLYALLDEWHQAYSPGRVCDWKDVLIDAAGVLFGIWLMMLFKMIWRKKHVHD